MRTIVYKQNLAYIKNLQTNLASTHWEIQIELLVLSKGIIFVLVVLTVYQQVLCKLYEDCSYPLKYGRLP